MVTRKHQSKRGVPSEWAPCDCTGCALMKPLLTYPNFARGASCIVFFSNKVTS